MGAFDTARELAASWRASGEEEILRLMEPVTGDKPLSLAGCLPLSQWLYVTKTGQLVSTALTAKPLRRGAQIRFRVMVPRPSPAPDQPPWVAVYLVTNE